MLSILPARSRKELFLALLAEYVHKLPKVDGIAPFVNAEKHSSKVFVLYSTYCAKS